MIAKRYQALLTICVAFVVSAVAITTFAYRHNLIQLSAETVFPQNQISFVSNSLEFKPDDTEGILVKAQTSQKVTELDVNFIYDPVSIEVLAVDLENSQLKDQISVLHQPDQGLIRLLYQGPAVQLTDQLLGLRVKFLKPGQPQIGCVPGASSHKIISADNQQLEFICSSWKGEVK